MWHTPMKLANVAEKQSTTGQSVAHLLQFCCTMISIHSEELMWQIY